MRIYFRFCFWTYRLCGLNLDLISVWLIILYDTSSTDCTNSGELDIVFSVSGRATPGETQASFGLIKSVLSKMKLGPTHMQAGLARRDCLKSWDAIALNTHDSHESFAADLDVSIGHIILCF